MFDSCICVELDCQNEFSSDPVIYRARKVHICGECCEEIQIGDRYEYASGKCEGRFWTAKTCLPCKRVRDSLFTCGWAYGEIWSEIHESICRAHRDTKWVCDCGAVMPGLDPDWRWNGRAWEHWHGAQVGHLEACWLDDEEFCVCPERKKWVTGTT